jgi:hypothetical protein
VIDGLCIITETSLQEQSLRRRRGKRWSMKVRRAYIPVENQGGNHGVITEKGKPEKFPARCLLRAELQLKANIVLVTMSTTYRLQVNHT